MRGTNRNVFLEFLPFMSSRIFMTTERLLAGAIFLTTIFATAPSCAQSSGTLIRIDASQLAAEPGTANYGAGTATTPTAVTLGLNSRYLTRNGKPWLPVMGEFHYSRVPRDQWEDEILKMKASGVNIISTYAIWIHHEEIKGQFDWTGQRDLRAFALLCQKHGMDLVVRIGPWVHGEVRNGGLPDWVLRQGPTRVNDPAYLASVRAWYAQIGLQLKGQLWKDGGPVIGVQLENEYAQRGPGAGEAHILELKKSAIASGLDVPFYFVTGWDNAVVPPRAVIPVYGGYPDAPWESSTAKLPPSEVYAFRFESRVSSIVNADRAHGESIATKTRVDQLPYLTAEIGAGNEDTYHRRPVITADDIASMAPVMLGSGVNLYGTYMFHGGENPDGKLSTLQESQDTGYPNDLPIKSYDFQAPLGEFGEERASFRKLKVFQYFLNDFGADLAPMTVHPPMQRPHDSTDLASPRASVRANGDSGFIFFNNYVRNYAMPARKATQFLIRLPQGELTVPHEPIDLPSRAYFIWPFNLNADGVILRYSTAQLFTRLDDKGIDTFYFEALPGIPGELAFKASTVDTVESSNGKIIRDSGTIYVRGVEPGVNSSIDVVSSSGKRVRMVLLTAREAENAWKVHINGGDHLVITEKDFLIDSDARPERIKLRSLASPQFAFIVTPPVDSLKASRPLTLTSRTSHAVSFALEVPAWDSSMEYRQTLRAGIAPPIKLGPSVNWRPLGVALAPCAGELPHAAKWKLIIAAGALRDLSELFLEVDYTGDVARFSRNHSLLDDNFFNGEPWAIGLKRFLAPDGPSAFELSILPLRKDAPVYFELPKPIQFEPNGQADKLNGIRLVPEYQVEITEPPL
jgi:hypothetical protein